MLDRIDVIERILNLTSFLLGSHRPQTRKEIFSRVPGYKDDYQTSGTESLTKRLRRDMNALRVIGFPIAYVTNPSGEDGYVLSKNRALLPSLNLSDDERDFLLMAGEGARHLLGGAWATPILSVMKKLRAGAELPHAVPEYSSYNLAMPEPRGQAALHQALAGAIKERREITFDYHAPGRPRIETRKVRPYALSLFSSHWYLVGYCLKRRKVRCFRLSRFSGQPNLSDQGQAFKRPSGFNPMEHVGLPSWRIGRGRCGRARIRFSPDIAWMMAENLRPDELFEEDQDGGGVLAFDFSNHEALLRWVLKFHRHATILEPSWLRRLMVQRLRAMLRAYPDRL